MAETTLAGKCVENNRACVFVLFFSHVSKRLNQVKLDLRKKRTQPVHLEEYEQKKKKHIPKQPFRHSLLFPTNSLVALHNSKTHLLIKSLTMCRNVELILLSIENI